MSIKCADEGCTYLGAWGFRAKKIGSPYFCDECWGHKYGDQVCRQCEKGCYEEDMEDNAETYLCGRCKREESHVAKEAV